MATNPIETHKKKIIIFRVISWFSWLNPNPYEQVLAKRKSRFIGESKIFHRYKIEVHEKIDNNNCVQHDIPPRPFCPGNNQAS